MNEQPKTKYTPEELEIIDKYACAYLQGLGGETLSSAFAFNHVERAFQIAKKALECRQELTKGD